MAFCRAKGTQTGGHAEEQLRKKVSPEEILKQKNHGDCSMHGQPRRYEGRGK
ncbi:MAG TPA: hypothetical protein VKE94_22750 [Gemmataceae bacterium]|nr:hypothetical protein [Gemmataceae bacterium]